MVTEELERWLRDLPNPFADRVLRNGFDEPPEDVDAIHRDERRALRRLIDEVRADGRPRLQVVTGEAGDGKTHLLATLRAESERSWRQRGHEHVLVPIDPLRDERAPFQHLLRWLAAGLSRELPWVSQDGSGPATAFELLLWRGFAQLVREVPFDAGAATAADFEGVRSPEVQAGPHRFSLALTEAWPRLRPAIESAAARVRRLDPTRIDQETFRILLRFPEPSLSRLVLRWLGAEQLSEDELFILGASQPVDDEEHAYRVLTTLFHFTDVPMVLGLDQLEGVHRLGDEAVTGLFGALTHLYTGGGRFAVLLFCTQAIWIQLQSRLEKHFLDRLEPEPLNLKRIAPELGEQLVARRLAGPLRGLGIEAPHPTFPFPEGYVRRHIEQENISSPREVLRHFALIGLTSRPPPLTSAPEPTLRPEPPAVAEAAWRQALAKLEKDRTMTPEQRADNAQAALRHLWQAAEGKKLGDTSVADVRPGAVRRGVKEGLIANLERAGRRRRVYLEASNSLNGQSAAATAKRLSDALKTADRAIWLREKIFALPEAAKATVQDARGKVRLAELSEAEALALAATEKLLDAVATKEVELTGEQVNDALLATIAPQLKALSRAMAAAFEPENAPTAEGDLARRIGEALDEPPGIATETTLGERLGAPTDAVSAAARELEEQNRAAVLKTRDGARVVVRRPR